VKKKRKKPVPKAAREPVWEVIDTGPLPQGAIKAMADLLREIARERLQTPAIDKKGQGT
jgi:hypothetical protein